MWEAILNGAMGLRALGHRGIHGFPRVLDDRHPTELLDGLNPPVPSVNLPVKITAIT
jgi:hypothetical protein